MQGSQSTQHTRPLWVGLLACAMSVPLLLIADLLWLGVDALSVAIVGFGALLYALPVSFGVAQPYVRWLRRRGRLHARWVAPAGVLMGAVLIIALLRFAAMITVNHHPMFSDIGTWQDLSFGTVIGGVLGLLAALALCVGAGIPFRTRARA